MNTVISKDGTAIAFDRTGRGPALIVVDGALCYRASGPSAPLAAVLAPHFTVYTYDRRGRGDSTDTAPYTIEREVEDIAALIAEADGQAYVYGCSSGAVLALEAANRLQGIRRLALYEAPFVVDDTLSAMPDNYLPQLKAMVAEDRRSDAVKFFMKRVGVPGFFLVLMPMMPVWGKLKSVAPTLVYDITLVHDFQKGKPLPKDQWGRVTMPTLVGVGGKSPAWMRNGMRNLAGVLPNAKHQVLEGQTHMVKAQAVAQAVVPFFQE